MKISYFDNDISILESIKMNSKKIDILNNQEVFVLKGYLSKKGVLSIIFQSEEANDELINKLSKIYAINDIIYPDTENKETSFSDKYIEYSSNSATIFNLDENFHNYFKDFFEYKIKHQKEDNQKLMNEGVQFSFLIIDKYIDHLTSLPNNGLLYKIVGIRNEDVTPLYSDILMEIKFNHIRPKNTVIFFDLNNLKSMNDIYGHAIADTMLIEYSKLLIEEFPDFMHFRIGGDEFITITNNEQNAIDMIQRTNSIDFSNKIKERINAIHNVEIDTNLLIISSGGYEVFEKYKDFEQVKNQAEQKMYINKRILHLTYGVYDREKRVMKNKISDISKLQHILESDEYINSSTEEKLNLLTYERVEQ